LSGALEQHWPGSGSRDSEASDKHNFFNTCPNGASEVFIGICKNIDDDRVHVEVMWSEADGGF
jgi:hypothetical protein